MRYGSAWAKEHHYLIIGPWDHPGTRTPKREVGGITFGEASLVDDATAEHRVAAVDTRIDDDDRLTGAGQATGPRGVGVDLRGRLGQRGTKLAIGCDRGDARVAAQAFER